MSSKRVVLGILLTVAVALLLLAQGSVFYQANYSVGPVSLDPNYQLVILRDEIQAGANPGTNKTFIWRSEDRAKTDFALIQLHGFSATRREMAPLPERIAEKTHSNLFMTRLTGHGLGSEGMALVTAEALLRDAEEAIAVGREMGERIVLLGTSTGATLAIEMAARHPEVVAGLILVSPNFRPARPESVLLKGPVGRWVAKNFVKEHRWQPSSDDESKFWTTTYPATAIHELMNLLSFLNRRDLGLVKTPALLVSSDRDQVVSVDLIQSRMATYGGPLKIEVFEGAHHVLAGDIKGPENNDRFVDMAVGFLESLRTPTAD